MTAALAAGDLPATAHVAFALQTSLALVFLGAAASKLRTPRKFVTTVAEYRIGPRQAAGAVAAGVVAVELFVAVSFLAGLARSVAAVAAVVTLALFAVAVAVNLRRGREIPCGCFGAESEPISGRSIRRVAMLSAAAIAVIVLDRLHAPGLSIASLIRERGDGIGAAARDLALAAAVGLAAIWVVEAPALVALARLNRFPKPNLDEQPEGGA